jgi:hypothetical protein
MTASPGKKTQSLPDILAIVTACVREAGEIYGFDTLKNPTPATRLYGEGGVLDSMALVSLVIDVEEKVAGASGVSISLSSERALSRKHSPFGSVQALADFCVEQLREAGGA